jgi:hypothetical protein
MHDPKGKKLTEKNGEMAPPLPEKYIKTLGV